MCLRILINTVNRSTRQLAVVGCPVQYWDSILVHFLLTRMPEATKNNWETSRALRQMPILAEVVAFLERQARGNINLTHYAKVTHHQQNNTGAKPKQPQAKSNDSGSKQPDSLAVFCYYCEKPHPTYRCSQFNQMSLKNRRTCASELKLFFVCLTPGHRAGASVCKLGNCPNCQKRHNRVLCDQTKSINVALQSISDCQQQQSINSSTNQVVPSNGTVQYKGAINHMQMNVWNQGISNTPDNQNFQ